MRGDCEWRKAVRRVLRLLPSKILELNVHTCTRTALPLAVRNSEVVYYQFLPWKPIQCHTQRFGGAFGGDVAIVVVTGWKSGGRRRRK